MGKTAKILYDAFLQQRYDRLWSDSIKRISSGTIEIDPVLARRETDRRRGFTLLFRPPPSIQQKVVAFLEELHKLEPDQHYYHATELHVTILSLFTATEEPAARFTRTDEYIAAVTSFVEKLAAFPMCFAGLTASPGALMIQGFTDAAALNAARDKLRGELRGRGLTHGLDERYRLETAHMTVARFRQPLRDGDALAKALMEMRSFDFGETCVDSLELVRNDWYMSRASTECLRKYQLTAARNAKPTG